VTAAVERSARRKRRAARLSTRFHHMIDPVTNSTTGSSPSATHSDLVFQPAKFPK